jgi:hypothetical protein
MDTVQKWLKKPLTSIVSYVDLLKKQAMPNDQAREPP